MKKAVPGSWHRLQKKKDPYIEHPGRGMGRKLQGWRYRWQGFGRYSPFGSYTINHIVKLRLKTHQQYDLVGENICEKNILKRRFICIGDRVQVVCKYLKRWKR